MKSLKKTALTLTAVMLLGVVVPSASETELSTEEVTESISETTHWDKGTFASVPLKHSRRRSPSGTSL